MKVFKAKKYGDNADNAVRQVVEFAVAAARNNQSGQTGYIHHCYQEDDEGRQDTIPILENLLFALALLRVRTPDTAKEGKALLERLLYFQNRSVEPGKGSFPIYLHQYPFCKSRTIGISLLAPLYWIMRHHQSILGEDLFARLKEAAMQLLTCVLATHEEKPAAYPFAMQVAAAAQAYGSLLSIGDLESKGKKQLQKLQQKGPCDSWYSPESLGQMICALQMLYPSLEDSPWKPFWKHLCMTWHHPTLSYAGPIKKEMQYGYEPLPTFYDLFMGTFTGSYSYRTSEVHPLQLYGALIQSSKDTIPNPTGSSIQKGTIGKQKWQMVQTKDYAFTVMQKKEAEADFIPFRLVWGDRTRVHTLVNLGNGCSTIDYTAQADGVDLTYQLQAGEQEKKVVFFFDAHDGLMKTVEGEPATVLQLGEQLQLQSSELKIDCRFEQPEQEASASFMGHLAQGNRPSQLSHSGTGRFTSFDWKLMLRAVKREGQPSLKASIRLEVKK